MKRFYWMVLVIGATSRPMEGQGIDSLLSPGPLSQAHSSLRGLQNCTACHTRGRGVEGQKCLRCHRDLAARIDAGTGFHRDKRENCLSCHQEHQGENFSLIRWDPGRFDHQETGYPLVGRHRAVGDCVQCHRPENAPARNTRSYLLNDKRCVACHTDVHQGRLGVDCERCHRVENPFRAVQFDHRNTSFPLTGAHRSVECRQCHPKQQWKGIAFSTCTACHQDPHRPSLGSDCQRCHDTSSFGTSRFDHDSTRYPLLGRHREVECTQCHAEGRFRDVEFAQCGDCHREDPHWGQFAEDCGECHRVEGFQNTTFDHQSSDYPLTGKHDSVQCAECHRTEESAFPKGLAKAVRYKPIASECASCHRDVHLGQFKNSCRQCHSTNGFELEVLLFRHERDSRFQLIGSHARLLCEQCHAPEDGRFPMGAGTTIRYRPLSAQCSACHVNVHDPEGRAGATVPQLANCERCHGNDSFVVQSFDHARTAFPLDGRHADLSCERCHPFVPFETRSLLSFVEFRTACAECHDSPHPARMDDCLKCHNSSSWQVRVRWR